MTLLQLRYVYEVEKSGSIHAAAARLFVSQPNISKQISSLEEELGITIFKRVPNGVVLTPDGQKLIKYINEVLYNMDYIEQHFKDVKDYPSLAVSAQHFSVASEAFCLLQAELAKKEMYSLTLNYEKTDEIFDAVQAQRSEIGILVRDEKTAPAFDRLVNYRNLEFVKLFEERPSVFLARTHPLADHGSIALSELQDYPVTIYSQTHSAPHYFSEELMIPELHSGKLLYVNDLYSSVLCMKMCNAYDIGTGFLSADLRESLVAVPLEWDAVYTFGYLKVKNAELSILAQTFVNLILCCAKESLGISE